MRAIDGTFVVDIKDSGEVVLKTRRWWKAKVYMSPDLARMLAIDLMDAALAVERRAGKDDAELPPF